jgi:hypothetical protein
MSLPKVMALTAARTVPQARKKTHPKSKIRACSKFIDLSCHQRMRMKAAGPEENSGPVASRHGSDDGIEALTLAQEI